MKKLLLLITIMSFILISCKDDKNTTGPSGESVTFPLAVGNWWEYNEYEYDASTGTQGMLLSSYRLEVVEKTTFKGKEAYRVESNTDDDEFDGSYLSNEGGNLWVGGLTIEDDEFGLTPDWIKFYDAGSNTWEVMKVEFSQEGTEFKLIGTGSYQGETTISYRGKSYTGIKFRNVLKTDVSFNLFGEQITQSSTTTSDYILVDGMGLYKITTMNEEVDEEDPNTVEVLMDFMVN